MLGLNNRDFMDAETARRVYQVYHQVYQTGKANPGFFPGRCCFPTAAAGSWKPPSP